VLAREVVEDLRGAGRAGVVGAAAIGRRSIAPASVVADTVAAAVSQGVEAHGALRALDLHAALVGTASSEHSKGSMG